MLSAHRENLFDVLELPESATPMEAERSGQRLLGLLAAGHKPSARFSTWSGQAERTEDLVRQAMQASKDPAQLLLHAFWKQSLQKLDSSRRGRTLAGELRLLTAPDAERIQHSSFAEATAIVLKLTGVVLALGIVSLVAGPSRPWADTAFFLLFLASPLGVLLAVLLAVGLVRRRFRWLTGEELPSLRNLDARDFFDGDDQFFAQEQVLVGLGNSDAHFSPVVLLRLVDRCSEGSPRSLELKAIHTARGLWLLPESIMGKRLERLCATVLLADALRREDRAEAEKILSAVRYRHPRFEFAKRCLAMPSKPTWLMGILQTRTIARGFVAKNVRAHWGKHYEDLFLNGPAAWFAKEVTRPAATVSEYLLQHVAALTQGPAALVLVEENYTCLTNESWSERDSVRFALARDQASVSASFRVLLERSLDELWQDTRKSWTLGEVNWHADAWRRNELNRFEQEMLVLPSHDDVEDGFRLLGRVASVVHVLTDEELKSLAPRFLLPLWEWARRRASEGNALQSYVAFRLLLELWPRHSLYIGNLHPLLRNIGGQLEVLQRGGKVG